MHVSQQKWVCLIDRASSPGGPNLPSATPIPSRRCKRRCGIGGGAGGGRRPPIKSIRATTPASTRPTHHTPPITIMRHHQHLWLAALLAASASLGSVGARSYETIDGHPCLRSYDGMMEWSSYFAEDHKDLVTVSKIGESWLKNNEGAARRRPRDPRRGLRHLRAQRHRVEQRPHIGGEGEDAPHLGRACP